MPIVTKSWRRRWAPIVAAGLFMFLFVEWTKREAVGLMSLAVGRTPEDRPGSLELAEREENDVRGGLQSGRLRESIKDLGRFEEGKDVRGGFEKPSSDLSKVEVEYGGFKEKKDIQNGSEQSKALMISNKKDVEDEKNTSNGLKQYNEPSKKNVAAEGENITPNDLEQSNALGKAKQVIILASSPRRTPLIVGCGRSGTMSLAHYLHGLGINSTHEAMESNFVSVSWLYAVPDAPEYPFEKSISALYRKNLIKAAMTNGTGSIFGPVVHAVRNPLNVISSTRRCFCGRGTRTTELGALSDAKSWRFVESAVKMPKPDLPYHSLLRSMVYWYEWNTRIPQWHAIVNRFRIEDLNPNELIQALGVNLKDIVEIPNRIPRAPLHVSAVRERKALPDAAWEDLRNEDDVLAEKIFSLAVEYGYEKGSLDEAITAARQKADAED